MAFCPECGKAVAPESAKCASCGYSLPKSEQKTAGARFKGTVMMTAPIIGAEPANVNAKKPAPALEQKIAVSAVAQAKAASAADGRGSAKATMIGAGVPPEVIAAAQAQAAGAAKISAKAANGPIARAGGAQVEPKLTAAGAPAKLGGAQHRKVPEAAQTKRSAPPPKAAPETNPKAPVQTKELGSPTNAKAPINPKAASQAGPKAAVPQTNPKLAAPQTSPRVAPVKAQQAAVSATANTDEPPAPTVPSVRAMKNVPISQPPVGAQFAATQAALPGPPPRPAHVMLHEPSIVVDAEAELVTAAPMPMVAQAEHAEPLERTERYLPGDPMAPPHATPLRAHAPRTTVPGDEELTIPRDERKWLYWAVCGAVVLVVMMLAIGLF